MEQRRRLLQTVDDFQQRHHWLAFPVAVTVLSLVLQAARTWAGGSSTRPWSTCCCSWSGSGR
ncbi:MAG TPA: hypothetical protein VFJ69_04345 [Actinomycetota bacterium]|nr:hypothetical protein [Actinomycetota bacterium]